MLAGMSPVMIVMMMMIMGRLTHKSLPRLAALAMALSSSFSEVGALPALPLPPSLSLTQANTSSPLARPYPRPPDDPACPSTPAWGVSLGHPSASDCDYVLSNLYPKDPVAKPVMRNFYSAPRDVSQTLNNFRLPYEKSYSIVSPPALI